MECSKITSGTITGHVLIKELLRAFPYRNWYEAKKCNRNLMVTKRSSAFRSWAAYTTIIGEWHER